MQDKYGFGIPSKRAALDRTATGISFDVTFMVESCSSRTNHQPRSVHIC